MAERLTLSMLAGLERETPGVPADSANRENLRESLQKAAAFDNLAAYALGERLRDFLCESLAQPVADILGEAWKQSAELQAMAEEQTVSEESDVESHVELYDHSITCAFHPSVELKANGVTVATMTFDVNADLKLEAIQVVIRNACITRVKAGQLTSEVTLAYKDQPLMPPCETTVDLPLALELPGEGIRLAG